MDHLWSPWRYRYVTKSDSPAGCVFCQMVAEQDDPKNLILLRGKFNFAVLNLYPYTNGHLMIVPYSHVPSLTQAQPEALTEMMWLAKHAEAALGKVYGPQGINLGMNLGECAGAGVAGHIHMHIVPRWFGDANFMSVTAETRVHIEELPTTWTRLQAALREELHPPIA